MFDILADSAMDIARGLLDEAWGGSSPDGGLDFPSACVLSRASEQTSDMHVDLGVVDDTEQLSAVPWLADVTHTDVQGPSDSDAPFRYQSGELIPPGMFGKALRAYGQVVALAGEYGVDIRGYDSWFREQWGVDPNADLSLSVPIVRSHGDALWGGINRKLSPYSSAQAATSKQVRVQWHGKGRKDMGEHAVVAWPRLTAIAQIAGGALMVEDRRARGRIKRIDFRVVRHELPKAPKNLGTGLGRIKVRDKWELRTISRGAIEFIQGFRATALILARGGLGATAALSVDPGVEMPATAILRYLQEQSVPGIPHVNFLAMGDAVFDLEPTPVKRPLAIDGGTKMNVYNAFAAVTRPFIDKHFHELPTARTLRQAADAVNESARAEASQIVIRRALALAIPDDFLLRMYRLYTVANRDVEKGNEIVSSALKTFGAPRSVFETRDWVAVGRRVKNSLACRGWFTEEIARGVGRYTREHGQQAPIVGRLRRILSSEGTGDIAVSEVVRQRRNWWSHEYRRRSRDRPTRRVEYQIRSKLFRVAHVDIKESGAVSAPDSTPQLVGALAAVARAYLRKRKGKGQKDPVPPDPGRMTLLQYAHHLDLHLRPNYLFVSGVDQFLRSLKMLEDDVVAIMGYIAENMPDHAYPVGIELEEAPPGDDDPDDGTDGDWHHIERAHEALPPATVLAPVGNLFGDDDDDDDEDEVDVMAGLVRLADELAEDYPALEFKDITSAVASHGEFVSAHEYKEIGAAVHAAYLVRVSKGGPGSELGGADIMDTRRR
jgi:hypothetical protein